MQGLLFWSATRHAHRATKSIEESCAKLEWQRSAGQGGGWCRLFSQKIQRLYKILCKFRFDQNFGLVKRFSGGFRLEELAKQLHAAERVRRVWRGEGQRLSAGFYQFLSVSISFYQFLSVSISFYQFLSVSISFYQFLSVSISFYQFLSVSIKVSAYALQIVADHP